MAKAVTDVVAPNSDDVLATGLDFLGTPLIALAIAVIVGMLVLGRGAHMNRATVQKSLPPIAGILLIVGAGGGFKRVLIDTGIGQVIANAVEDSGLSVLLPAWIVAAAIRVATGSATVAIVAASGILAPLAADLSTGEVSLMVLAVGVWSVFLSHVNDAGLWLVKEYLGTGDVEDLDGDGECDLRDRSRRRTDRRPHHLSDRSTNVPAACNRPDGRLRVGKVHRGRDSGWSARLGLPGGR